MTKLVVAFSGGKDSTALALRLKELGEDFKLLFTPTGNELPELYKHLYSIVTLLDKELILPKAPTLEQLIIDQKMLPSWHSRWCTRMIKIVPCIAWLKANPGHTLAVGLRADEETRVGLYGDYATYRYPLAEWGWREREVLDYVESKGITIPTRTDCALCPYQRIGEWYRLWKFNRPAFDLGIRYEDYTEHTIRSPSSATRKDGSRRWAVSLRDLAAQFESGDKPRTLDDSDEERSKSCRVCRM